RHASGRKGEGESSDRRSARPQAVSPQIAGRATLGRDSRPKAVFDPRPDAGRTEPADRRGSGWPDNYSVLTANRRPWRGSLIDRSGPIAFIARSLQRGWGKLPHHIGVKLRAIKAIGLDRSIKLPRHGRRLAER